MADGTPPARLLDRLLAPEGGPWRALFEAGPWGAALLDRAGYIRLANPALARLAGVGDAARLNGLAFAELFAPAQRPDLARAVERALVLPADSSAAPVIADLPPTPDTEQPAAAMIAFTAIRDAAGSAPEGVVVRVVDVSAQRRLEQQLAQAQKMHAIGQLAAGIAHDFNNLLTAIGLTADEAGGRLADAGAIAGDLAQIRRSTQRGAALVKKLLAFARKQTMQPRVIVLNEAIEDLSMLLRRLLGANITLALDLDAAHRAVRVDPTWFDQVIVNLAVNARDAMPRGGRLTLRTGQVNLFRPLTRGRETIPPGRYAMVEVEDTGTGIPENYLDRIFEPFFTTKKETGGTGLGLATVWGIVRQMEGFVAVDSTPGEGTTFRVYLPRVDEVGQVDRPGAAASVSALRPAANPPTDAVPRGGTILIADDEEMIRLAAARALGRAGWNVVQAGCGDAALDLIASRDAPLAALVTDMVMPGADGEAVIRAARARWPDLPVIITSGYAEGQGGDGATRRNVTWLAKPYDSRQLLRAAACAVGRVAAEGGAAIG